MTDILTNPAIVKLLEYAKKKKTISYDEVNDFLPEAIVNSEKIEEVIALLEKNNVHLEEEDVNLEDAEVAPRPAEKKKIVYNEKDTAIDDPIRLYLREIGKENLLTAEQEVELSKQMEEGENIIKRVIRHSGMLIPEFYSLAQKAFSKKDPKDLNLSKKEISEYLAEKRRLEHFYREMLRPILPTLKQYIEQKRKIVSKGEDILDDDELGKKRQELLDKLGSLDIHQDEIIGFSDKFLNASRKIKKYRKEQEKIEKRLKVSNLKELRNLGRGLANARRT